MKTGIFTGLLTLFLATNAIAVKSPNTYKISDQKTDTISLFNGKDLTGWGYRKKTQEKIVFESFEWNDRIKRKSFFCKRRDLTVNPFTEGYAERYGAIWTAKVFMKVVLYWSFVHPKVGLIVVVYLRGTQLQCRDYLLAGPYKNLKNYKPQDWNKIEVVVKKVI